MFRCGAWVLLLCLCTFVVFGDALDLRESYGPKAKTTDDLPAAPMLPLRTGSSKWDFEDPEIGAANRINKGSMTSTIATSTSYVKQLNHLFAVFEDSKIRIQDRVLGLFDVESPLDAFASALDGVLEVLEDPQESDELKTLLSDFQEEADAMKQHNEFMKTALAFLPALTVISKEEITNELSLIVGQLKSYQDCVDDSYKENPRLSFCWREIWENLSEHKLFMDLDRAISRDISPMLEAYNKLEQDDEDDPRIQELKKQASILFPNMNGPDNPRDLTKQTASSNSECHWKKIKFIGKLFFAIASLPKCALPLGHILARIAASYEYAVGVARYLESTASK